MPKRRIMAIAPYEGLKEIISKVAQSYDECEVVCTQGDLLTGVELAQRAEREGFDIIMSRGGTSELITENVKIPVINIEVSGYDYLRAIKLAENIVGKKAFIGFSYITERAKDVGELLTTDIDIFTIQAQDEIAGLLQKLSKLGYSLIIGDTATHRTAKELGMNAMLLTSGDESVHAAFQSATRMLQSFDKAQKKLELLRFAIDVSGAAVAVYENGERTVSSPEYDAMKINEADVAQLMTSFDKTDNHSVVLKREQSVLRLGASRLKQDGEEKFVITAFSESYRDREVGKGVVIRNFTMRPGDIRDQLSKDGTFDERTINSAAAICDSDRPLLITGDVGVGKNRLALAVHRCSDRWNTPFITINCAYADPVKVVAELEGIPDGGTLCFDSVEKLTAEQQNRLANMLETVSGGPWRLIAISASDLGEALSSGKTDAALYRFFSELSLHIAGINDARINLERVVNLYIIDYNTDLGKQVTGIKPDALEMLKRHEWRYNFGELRSVVRQAMLTGNSHFIEAEDVAESLRNHGYEKDQSVVDLHGTLDDIERRIIKKVIQQESGNHSRAAKRLGIGRSTLWRKLQSEKDPV